MAIVLANGKKAHLLDNLMTDKSAYHYRLYVNNLTPTGANVVGDFTECTDSGYAYQIPVFGSASLNGSSQGEMDAPSLVWVFSHGAGDFTVYGYYVTDGAGALVYSQRAASPTTITASGQAYFVTPLILLDTMP